jgi:tRNA(Ile)-lysidine synthase
VSTVSKNASAADAPPVAAAEAKAFFDDLTSAPGVVLAVSGGPDSTALLMLAARWRASLRAGPDLLAVTIDHGLRPDSAREADAVKKLAAKLGVRHSTLRWMGRKPKTGLQAAAREMRYRVLANAARGAGATHVLTGHTLDDQAETVLFRMARGSGLTGLAGMARDTPVEGIRLVRPLLDVPKARLIATLKKSGIAFANDPSNRDPRFTRARLRDLLPSLADEGLDARRMALLARRMRRANETIEIVVDAAAEAVSETPWPDRGPVTFNARRFALLPTEVALRLLGRAVDRIGDEGPAQLAKLEALYEALRAPGDQRVRRTLAGALVTLAQDCIQIEPAPPRRRPGGEPLTTHQQGRRRTGKRL